MSSAARWVKFTAVAIAASALLSFAVLSVPWCRQDPSQVRLSPPTIARGEGILEAGAARVELVPPFPIVGGAGYAPPRKEVLRSATPLHARALVLRQGNLRWAWVHLELVTSPASLREAVLREAGLIGLSEIWLSVTHTHSSLGSYDPRTVSEWVGTGHFRPEVESLLVNASIAALREALQKLEPVTVSVGSQPLEGFAQPRSGDHIDTALTVVKLQGQKPIAQWILLSGHPTVLPRHFDALSGDYPGELARREEALGQGVTWVVQTAAGNAKVSPELRTPEAAAGFVENALRSVPTSALPTSALLVLKKHDAPLPPADASRWGWALFHRPLENLLCSAIPKSVVLEQIELGDFKLLAIPGEPTATAGEALARASGARVVGLTNGYLGYVEDPEKVSRREGEARRQYFTADLLPALVKALTTTN